MSPLRRRLLFGVPLAVAVAGGAGFYTILRRMQDDEYNPHALPSPLIGKRPPAFTLPGADGSQGFSNTDLLSPAKPMLVNWFASWCAPCREEAPILRQLADSGMTIWGIAYQDHPDDLAAYLKAYGNPYRRVASDESGLTAINWGVYGVPETYFIDKTGIVRLRYAGALTKMVLDREIMPLFRQYS
ncbi:DsbE family thiol:disulfide interchange protein [Acidocella sp.]|uniref:DsbE family thiol:disulfide interchange protein n=1 Tax=Acidocella sp. TaxID=50710 RepID=UPI003D03B583